MVLNHESKHYIVPKKMEVRSQIDKILRYLKLPMT